ncbi:MAG: RHS repeat-associated core domain-containing protein [Chlorobi bacterium]|nr:RHS repeat-associated core domain-containing protein [Chlorobiota bacterium]
MTRPDGAKEYRFFDHLGSSRAVLGINGFTYSDYAPFGGLLAGGTESRKGFIGKEKDRESDLRNHGVRLFDDEAGRFLSIDPLWEKYKLLTPYQYGANNPLMISDPDGMKLWLHKDDVKNPSPAFRKWYKEFKKAIKYLNSGKASGVLARLHKSKDVTYIRPTFSETRYEADKKTIYWSAEYGLRLSNGYTQTPALGLIHEGGHRALELEKTPEQMKELLEKSDNKFENKEEQQVYEKYENPAAVKLGEPLAPDHGGQIEETDGSDQRNPDMPVVTTVPLETLND